MISGEINHDGFMLFSPFLHFFRTGAVLFGDEVTLMNFPGYDVPLFIRPM